MANGVTLTGGVGNETLDGGVGDDTLTGGAGNDTFKFDLAGGTDVVTDFTAGEDLIDLREIAGITDFSDLALVLVSDDRGVIIDLTGHGGGTMLLKGVGRDALGSENFMFFGGIYGTESADTLDGTTNDDAVAGRGGNDTIDGQGRARSLKTS